jgi:hypothetical protein
LTTQQGSLVLSLSLTKFKIFVIVARMADFGANKELSLDELTLEDVKNPRTIMFSCSAGGAVFYPPDFQFKAPPSDSPYAGRLVLVISKTGSIGVKIDYEPHMVTLSVVEGGADNQLLLRIPIGVRIFNIKTADGDFLYYETSDGYNILPYLNAKGTDPGQKLQELLLLVSPVPPRDPSAATDPLVLKKLTLHQLNARRVESGLPPLPVKPTERR